MAKPQYTDGQRVKLSVDAIRTDRGTQSRKQMSKATVAEYAALMREGVEFEPITVFWTPDEEHVLSRGFHRLASTIDAGRRDIDAIVRLGTLADAKWDSAGSNKHGLRCTPDDYREAVALALAAKPKTTDREIARHLGIDGKTAAKYRPATADASAVQTRVGKDGKERKLPAKKPKADKPAQSPAPPSKPAAAPVKVTRDRGSESTGEDYQEAPSDGLPEIVVPPTCVFGIHDGRCGCQKATEGPKEPRQEIPLSERPPIFAGRDEDPPPSFDLPKAKDRARATFLALFAEFPRKHWGVLRECFDEASAEAEG